jgi:hypothetical protein
LEGASDARTGGRVKAPPLFGSSCHFAKVIARIGSATPEMTICWHSRARPIEVRMSGYFLSIAARVQGSAKVYGEYGTIRTDAMDP